MSLHDDETAASDTADVALEELGLQLAPGAIAGMLLGRYAGLLGSPDVWRHVDVPEPRSLVVDLRQAPACLPPVAELADRRN